MRRYPSAREYSYAFGPGPLSPAIKALIIANVAMYLVTKFVMPALVELLGLMPAAIFLRFWIWQPATYMFLHGSLSHILFNMLSLWMFGTELERLWGTPAFVRYYMTTGIAAGLTTVLVALFPFPATAHLYTTVTIGASGAIFALLLAYGLIFPTRTILLIIFPIQARYFVMIVGALVLLQAIDDVGGGVAHITHLGGLAAGYVMLRGRRLSPANEIRYRYLRWKMDRARKKFGIYSGGKKDNWDGKIH